MVGALLIVSFRGSGMRKRDGERKKGRVRRRGRERKHFTFIDIHH